MKKLGRRDGRCAKVAYIFTGWRWGELNIRSLMDVLFTIQQQEELVA